MQHSEWYVNTPDVRDGLTEVERTVLLAHYEARKEYGEPMIPMALLFGRVQERMDMSWEEFSNAIKRTVRLSLDYEFSQRSAVTLKSLLVLSVLVLFGHTHVQAQSGPRIQWQRCLGGGGTDGSYCIQATRDSGYILAGWTNSKDGNVTAHQGGYDMWVIKVDSIGKIQWQKSLGGSKDEHAYSVVQTSDGGYAVAGSTKSNDGDVQGKHGGNSLTMDAWVVKLSGTGSIEWQKCIGGDSDDIVYSIVQTKDDGFALAGYTTGNVTGYHGGYDAWVTKLDRLGALEWQRCYGGKYYESANSITVSNDGSFVIAGWTNSNDGDITGVHDTVTGDAWIVKLTSGGTLEWQRCIGGKDEEVAYSIIQTTDSGYAFVGHTYSDDGDVSGNHRQHGPDAWIVKLDTVGKIEWQECLGGTQEDEAQSLLQTPDGNFIIAGATYSNDGDVMGIHSGNNLPPDAWIVKLDAPNNQPNIVWQHCYGGADVDYAYSVAQNPSGAIAFAGYAKSNDADVSGNHGGNSDVWMVRLKADPASAIVDDRSTPLLGVRCFPNPAATDATIEFELAQWSEVTVDLCNALGETIRLISAGLEAGGMHQQDVDLQALPAGEYYVRLRSGHESVISGIVRR